MENRGLWVYDIETLKSCFTYTGFNIDTKEVVKYVIHKDRDDTEALIKHLNECSGMIGFNVINFDYPIIHMMLLNYTKWTSPVEAINAIYKKAQDIIEQQNQSTFSNTTIRTKDIKIPQLDLFRVWHYNNKARSTSLKALEISMNYPNVMEMPIHHDRDNITLEDIPGILEYNENDVMATYAFYLKSKDKIDLRKSIESKYSIPCINWNNGKIGEELILKLYCDKTGLNPWEVKKMRSNRSEIDLGACVPDNVVFTSVEFNKLRSFFLGKVITETKGSVDYSLIYKGLKYYYGTGGVHAAIKTGVYESDEEYVIETCDVASLYPNLALVYGFFIEHLGPTFLDVYKNDIVGVRLAEKAKPKDQQDKAIVDGYKEAANIPYGKSNDINSYLYDPLYSMKTTIAGQLVMSMLCERLAQIPGSQMLMVNTDGCEIRIPRKYQGMYKDICQQWEKETKLVLEFDSYQKMWIGDINNYGCISVKGKVKNKGRFEVDKVIGSEPAYHKDNSFRVVPLAIEQYFVKGTPVEETIRNHKEIYDFCGRQKFKGQDYGETHTLDYSNGIAYDRIDKQQKNTRYYISNTGSTFLKKYSKGSTEVINKGYQVTIFNQYIDLDIKSYNINYDFYIKEAYKELNSIVDRQLELF